MRFVQLRQRACSHRVQQKGRRKPLPQRELRPYQPARTYPQRVGSGAATDTLEETHDARISHSHN